MNKITYLCLLVCSAFFLNYTAVHATTNNHSGVTSDIQRVRIDFTMPNGYVRHLLLGFTPDNAASDGVDYGYDAPNVDNYPDDLNWMINDNRYVIQGVGAFDATKQYPLGMFLSNSGSVEIALNSLENFETAIAIYVYDALEETFTPLHDINFEAELADGTYLNRFYITFSNQAQDSNDDDILLSTDENHLEATSITYLTNSKQLLVKSNSPIDDITISNLLGKTLHTYQQLNTREVKISLETLTEHYLIVSTHSQGVQTHKIILKP